MRAIVQRVTEASVKVDDKIVGEIKKGFMVLLGVGNNDDENDIKYIADKIINLRVFEDENEKMNYSLNDVDGEVLLISQFTLYADCTKGRRPSFDKAGSPDWAKILYEKTCDYLKQNNIKTQTGIFGADMKVSLVNDGPVTLMLDSKKLF